MPENLCLYRVLSVVLKVVGAPEPTEKPIVAGQSNSAIETMDIFERARETCQAQTSGPIRSPLIQRLTGYDGGQPHYEYITYGRLREIADESLARIEGQTTRLPSAPLEDLFHHQV